MDESRSSVSGGLKLRSAKTTSFRGRAGGLSMAEDAEGSTVMGSCLTAIVSGRSIDVLSEQKQQKKIKTKINDGMFGNEDWSVLWFRYTNLPEPE